jgi:hypothetical protein
VDFGSVPATSVTFVSATQLQATSPAAGTSTVDVTVLNASKQSIPSSGDRFTYTPPPTPQVSTVSPTIGSAVGGTLVSIFGDRFLPASTVEFGTVPSPHVTYVSPTELQAISPAHTPGNFDVFVFNGSQQSPVISGDRFTYTTPAPTVSSVAPNSGPSTGGTVVTITGTGFIPSSVVNFGTAAATVTYLSSTSLKATAPAEPAGTVHIRVSNGTLQSPTVAGDQFMFNIPPGPVVTSITPYIGPLSGGTVVTITGTGFSHSSTVDFGATASSSVTFQSATSLEATSPAESAGTVDVRVHDGGHESPPVASDQFTYAGPPTVTSISPSAGSTDGGTVVTITGTVFTPSSTVQFGTTAAPVVTFQSPTSLQATSPAEPAGTVQVRVFNGAQGSASVAGDQFTFVVPAGPAVTFISPLSGSTAGGTVVTVNGKGFTATSTVAFGATVAKSVTFLSSNQLQATAPGESAGAVDVRVTDAGQESPIVAKDQFTFKAPQGPAVRKVAPASGPTSGGTTVTITGRGFTPSSTVHFGSLSGTAVTFFSTTHLEVTSPPESAHVVDVRVFNGSVKSPVVPHDQFTYLAPNGPMVSSISPSGGPSAGGTVVTINGSGFTSSSTVTFGSGAATTVTYFGTKKIQATAPAEPAGSVDVRVTDAGQESAAVPGDQFTYVK